MNKSEYQKILKGYAQIVEHEGVTHYINTRMNGDALTMMRDEAISPTERTIGLIACVLCDKDGIRIFDSDDKNDMLMIKSFDVDMQGEIVKAATKAFFPDKKKVLEDQP